MTPVSFVPNQSARQVHASLRRSLKAAEHAQQCSILWFADIMLRFLYRDFGCSSINQYAIRELGFSKTRTGDFIRLARQLDSLPGVRQALSSGELGYTKAREIVGVATPETEDGWLAAAKGSRKDLIREVKRVKKAAKVDSGQGKLLPDAPTVVAPKELPVRFQMDLTPAQEARRAAIMERLHKLGGVPGDRAELMLEALAALLESKEKAPRGFHQSHPPVQVHVHEYPDRMAVQTEAGERELSTAEIERIRCDSAVCIKGGRNSTTIPPRTRREILARDQHRCHAPGCGRTRFLEVHHRVPRSCGGNNQPENLITLCGSCHRLWHEKGTGKVAGPELSAGTRRRV
jgi:5-methylcytosine-specific restriction endonuclease McrA